MILNSLYVFLALAIFLAVCALVFVVEFKFELLSDRHGGYNVHHFLFGLGTPFLLLACMAIGKPTRELKPNAAFRVIRPKLIASYNRHVLGREYRFALLLTAGASFYNEALVYWLYNPDHGADWDHLASDSLGMSVAWLITKPLCARAAMSSGLRRSTVNTFLSRSSMQMAERD